MGVVDASILLVERNSPDHVTHRRRRKQQAGDDSAEIGLPIAKNGLEWCDQSFSCRCVVRVHFPGRDQEQRHANGEASDGRRYPETLPVPNAVDQRANRELAGGSAEHAEALCETDCGGEHAARKSMRRQEDSTGECEGRTRALQQSSQIAYEGNGNDEKKAANTQNNCP